MAFEKIKNVMKVMTPGMTGLSKIAAKVSAYPFLGENTEVIATYLLASAAWDLGELAINDYNFLTGKKVKPWNFFEKRVVQTYITDPIKMKMQMIMTGAAEKEHLDYEVI